MAGVELKTAAEATSPTATVAVAVRMRNMTCLSLVMTRQVRMRCVVLRNVCRTERALRTGRVLGVVRTEPEGSGAHSDQPREQRGADGRREPQRGEDDRHAGRPHDAAVPAVPGPHEAGDDEQEQLECEHQLS